MAIDNDLRRGIADIVTETNEKFLDHQYDMMKSLPSIIAKDADSRAKLFNKQFIAQSNSIQAVIKRSNITNERYNSYLHTSIQDLAKQTHGLNGLQLSFQKNQIKEQRENLKDDLAAQRINKIQYETYMAQIESIGDYQKQYGGFIKGAAGSIKNAILNNIDMIALTTSLFGDSPLIGITAKLGLEAFKSIANRKKEQAARELELKEQRELTLDNSEQLQHSNQNNLAIQSQLQQSTDNINSLTSTLAAAFSTNTPVQPSTTNVTPVVPMSKLDEALEGGIYDNPFEVTAQSSQELVSIFNRPNGGLDLLKLISLGVQGIPRTFYQNFQDFFTNFAGLFPNRAHRVRQAKNEERQARRDQIMELGFELQIITATHIEDILHIMQQSFKLDEQTARQQAEALLESSRIGGVDKRSQTRPTSQIADDMGITFILGALSALTGTISGLTGRLSSFDEFLNKFRSEPKIPALPKAPNIPREKLPAIPAENLKNEIREASKIMDQIRDTFKVIRENKYIIKMEETFREMKSVLARFEPLNATIKEIKSIFTIQPFIELKNAMAEFKLAIKEIPMMKTLFAPLVGFFEQMRATSGFFKVFTTVFGKVILHTLNIVFGIIGLVEIYEAFTAGSEESFWKGVFDGMKKAIEFFYLPIWIANLITELVVDTFGSEDVKAFFDKYAKDVTGKFSLLTLLQNGVMMLVDTVAGLGEQFWTGVWLPLWLFKTEIGTFGQKIKGAIDATLAFMRPFTTAISEVFSSFGARVATILAPVFEFFAPITNLVTKIATVFNNLFRVTSVVSSIGTMFKFLAGVVPKLLGPIGWFIGAFSVMDSFFESYEKGGLGEGLKAAFITLVDTVILGLPNFLMGLVTDYLVKPFFSDESQKKIDQFVKNEEGNFSIYKIVASGITFLVNTVGDWLSAFIKTEFMQTLITNVSKVVTGISEIFGNLFKFDTIENSIKSVINLFFSWYNLLFKAVASLSSWFLGLLGFDEEAATIKKLADSFSLADWIWETVGSIKNWFLGILGFKTTEAEGTSKLGLNSLILDSLLGISGFIKKVITLDETTINKLIDVVTWLPQKIVDGVNKVGVWLLKLFGFNEAATEFQTLSETTNLATILKDSVKSVRTWLTNLLKLDETTINKTIDVVMWLPNIIIDGVKVMGLWLQNLLGIKDEDVEKFVDTVTWLPKLIKKGVDDLAIWLMNLLGIDENEIKKYVNLITWLPNILSSALSNMKLWLMDVFSIDQKTIDQWKTDFSIIDSIEQLLTDIGKFFDDLFSFDFVGYVRSTEYGGMLLDALGIKSDAEKNAEIEKAKTNYMLAAEGKKIPNDGGIAGTIQDVVSSTMGLTLRMFSKEGAQEDFVEKMLTKYNGWEKNFIDKDDLFVTPLTNKLNELRNLKTKEGQESFANLLLALNLAAGMDQFDQNNKAELAQWLTAQNLKVLKDGVAFGQATQEMMIGKENINTSAPVVVTTNNNTNVNNTTRRTTISSPASPDFGRFDMRYDLVSPF